MDIATESEAVVPIQEDSLLQPLLHNKGSPHGKHQEDTKRVPSWLEYASCMIHLSVFGILGVITRYLLQKVFGPQGMGATHDGSVLYLDLPSNIIGSFLMGWFGVIFKTDIANVSDQLAIGISTGYLGSLTTFSGWNQKMLDLSVKGQWTFALLGFLLAILYIALVAFYALLLGFSITSSQVGRGMSAYILTFRPNLCGITLGFFLVAYSIILGIETAQGFRWLIQRPRKSLDSETCCPRRIFQVYTLWRHMVVIIVLVSMWGALWALSATMGTREFHDGGPDAQLWLGCLVGPFGVWVRWWLARFNGRGLGSTGLWRWLPFGTLMANVSAACMMAALATLKKAVNTKASVTVASGIQLGFLGCLSTVSTMMAEFNTMRVSSHPWRAYAYAFITIGISFGLGTLIYSVPIWVQGYE